MIDCIVCAWCDAVSADWVCWSTTYVEEFAYFCSNDCLMAWLAVLTAIRIVAISLERTEADVADDVVTALGDI